MVTHQIKIIANIHSDRAYSIVSNVTNWSNWVPVLASPPALLNGIAGVGAEYSFPSKSRSAQDETLLKIIELKPNREMKWQYSGGMTGWGCMKLAPKDQATEISMEEEVFTPAIPAQIFASLLEQGASNLKLFLDNTKNP